MSLLHSIALGLIMATVNVTVLISIRRIISRPIVGDADRNRCLRTIELGTHELGTVLGAATFYSALLGIESCAKVGQLKDYCKRHPGELSLTLIAGEPPTSGTERERLQELGRRVAFAVAKNELFAYR